ncbi:hypothetical protein BJ742DRAFT_304217 [Cladochytrium replicatum]|nr:hypothetical protein BJ742DRAFT_304217 [Cladochytrium replicatum]
MKWLGFGHYFGIVHFQFCGSTKSSPLYQFALCHTNVLNPFQLEMSGKATASVVGFLIGVTMTTWGGLLSFGENYQRSTASMITSVEELQSSTSKVKRSLGKIDTVEGDLSSLKAKAATQADLEKLRNELLKAIDEVNVSHLELKAYVNSEVPSKRK